MIKRRKINSSYTPKHNNHESGETTERENFTTGFLVGGPIGALIGGGIGLISGSLIGGITGRWLGSQIRPITKLSLIGIDHDRGRSYASVRSEADLGSPLQNVVYEIKWDQNVVPGGDHLNQNNIRHGTYVVDRSPEGETVGDRNSRIHKYFNDNNDSDNEGLHFSYTDGIEQQELNNGSWYFRLRVVEGNNTLSSSEIRIDWNH